MYGQRSAGFAGSGILTVGGLELGAHVLLWAALVMLACSSLMVGRRVLRRSAAARP